MKNATCSTEWSGMEWMRFDEDAGKVRRNERERGLVKTFSRLKIARK